MDLDAEGKKVYLVHQQDRSVKAQPMDWFYGKSRPNIHIGVPAAEYDWRDKKKYLYRKSGNGRRNRESDRML